MHRAYPGATLTAKYPDLLRLDCARGGSADLVRALR